ncbi:helix-turn-helix transcriptional regulator [Bacteroides sp.]|uniref:helix-turn-helix domain-containing protein n=1 Tax=Bacteroides sp. TaxID=29523 RepID=UPI0025C0BA32|nr:helix-turn-helix transcriptional regulator [Bacteroides sp.]
MIKNKKQYTMMKKQLEKLLTNIWDIKEILQKENNIQLRLQLGTFERGLVKLQNELEEYEKLTSKSLSWLEFDSFKDDMNKAIISFRIASDISQKKLAEEMFIQEQQIQRYEQSDYLSASFERILQLLEALEIRMILRKDFKKDTFKTTPANVWELSDEIRKRGSILQIAGEE